MPVLLVEDDASICETLGEHLEARGLTVTVVATYDAARQAMQRGSFLVIILDITLGDGSGLDLLEDLRRMGSSAHVIVVSSGSTDSDRVLALEHGADDYVAKPFHAPELVARVLAAKRRHDHGNDPYIRAGHLEINIAARSVLSSGESVELTGKEFDLLAFLATRPGYVFSRDELLRAVWHSRLEWQKATTVTEHIRRLRAKVERDPKHPQLLLTVRGAGYRFDRPAEARDAHNTETGVGNERDQAGDERDQAADRRDESADDRDEAADLRDKAGDHRDRAGDERDNAGTRRDKAAARRDVAAARLERRVEQRPGRAAGGPALARQEAASDRKDSAEDRQAGASERLQAESDRDVAQTERGMGADERAQAEADREHARADRSAGPDR